jgi:hypothetical protein
VIGGELDEADQHFDQRLDIRRVVCRGILVVIATEGRTDHPALFFIYCCPDYNGGTVGSNNRTNPDVKGDHGAGARSHDGT